MNCGENGSTDVKTFFWSSPVFRGKNSSSTNVKALWGQFAPTLSEKGRLCKKGLNFKVSIGVPEKNLWRATSVSHAIVSPPLTYAVYAVFFSIKLILSFKVM